MPTVLRKDGFRFFFFSDEGNEPPHVHVEKAECSAKFWVTPVLLEWTCGCRDPDLTRIEAIVLDHVDDLLEQWHAYFSL
jgi:hypothetical protein